MTVTVAVPTYNRASYLPATLASVLAQTRQPDQILVVDDGSTDATSAVLQEYGSQVESVYQENQGLAAARNTAQAQARGEAVLFLDSDDLLLPDALRELEKALESRPDAVLAYCQAQLIDAEGRLISPLWEADDITDDMWLRLVRGNCLRSAGAVLIRSHALQRIAAWDLDMNGSEDWDMWLRLAEIGPFARVARPLFQYRVHDSNMSSDKALMRWGGLRVYEKHLKRYEDATRRYSVIRNYYDGCFPASPDAVDTPLPDARVWPPLPIGAGSISEGHIATSFVPSSPALALAPRHRRLRRLLEGVGLAPLYRRTPLGLRHAIRRVFGVDIDAP